MSTTTQTAPLSVSSSMLASGLAQQASLEPLVAIYPNPEFTNSYYLVIHVYVPDDTTPILEDDFDVIVKGSTQAGDITMRQISIRYSNPTSMAVPTFSLWTFNVIYQVEGEEADAVQVMFVVGDPDTSRGTVTTVATT